ncbi:hypothetical protein [Vibrio tetraodonis]|uniref:hypothetical protein n=1 Tax=Vibrio tetraodonis TaxID=2231647 RepID=UPI000E0B6041|nr:hypothetical protein [Vibrio tetraodonis]
MKKIIALGLLFASSSVSAAYDCTGTVNHVLVYADGSVNLHATYRNAYTYVCNLKNDWKGVSPQACKGMLSTLLTAQSTGKTINTYYKSYTCETLPHYDSAPGPTYIGIVKS